MNTSVAVEMVSELNNAVNQTFPLYGNDILVYSVLLNRVVEHEKRKSGLDLSHRQDKDFIKVRLITITTFYLRNILINAL